MTVQRRLKLTQPLNLLLLSPQLMSYAVYELKDDSRSISSYCISKSEGYLIYTELTSKEPLQGYIKLKNLKNNSSSSDLKFPLDAPAQLSGHLSSNVQIVNASQVMNNKVERNFILIVNTGNGIQIVAFETFFMFGIEQHDKSQHIKWYHDEPRDRITSFCAYNAKGSYVHVVYCTSLGTIIKFSYNTITSTFTKIDEIKNAADDALNSCAPCFPPAWDENETIHTPEIIMSCFDNSMYLYDKTVQKVPVIDVFDDEKTVIYVEGTIAKRYSTKTLTFYICNVTNSGCHLFKRSTGGNWDLIEILTRDSEVQEKSPLVDCHIQCDGRTQLRITSGSEEGKLFCWKYDYRDETLMESQVLQVGSQADVVHCIQTINEKTYYMINADTIGYVNID